MKGAAHSLGHKYRWERMKEDTDMTHPRRDYHVPAAACKELHHRIRERAIIRDQTERNEKA